MPKQVPKLVKLGFASIARVMAEQDLPVREIARRLKAEHGVSVTHKSVQVALAYTAAEPSSSQQPAVCHTKARSAKPVRKDGTAKRPRPTVIDASYSGTPEDDRDLVNALVNRMRELWFYGVEEARVPRRLAQLIEERLLNDKQTSEIGLYVDRDALAEDGEPDELVRVWWVYTPTDRKNLVDKIAALLKFKWGTRIVVDNPKIGDAADGRASARVPADPEVAAALGRVRELPNGSLIYLLAGKMPPDDVGESDEDVREALEETAGTAEEGQAT